MGVGVGWGGEGGNNIKTCSTYISAIELLFSIHPAYFGFNRIQNKLL